MAKQEFTATYLEERIAFDNASGRVAVSVVEHNGTGPKLLSVKGPAEVSELIKGQTYRFFGRWSNYTNKRTQETERQFVYDTYIQSKPQGRRGVIEYLKRAGQGHGVGNARATKLWDLYQADAVRMVREDPQAVTEAIPGLKLHHVQDMAKWLEDQAGLEECTIEVMELLSGRKFPKSTTRKAILEFGNRAAEVIKRDPYVLMLFRGCGFVTCDSLYLELGKNPQRLLRQALLIWYSIASNSNGDTWFPVEHAFTFLRNGLSESRPGRALELAVRIGKLRADSEHDHGAVSLCCTTALNGPLTTDGQNRWIAEGKKARAECRLAELLVDSLDEVPAWPSITDLEKIDGHQQENLELATAGKIGILGGSPGTGKTFSAAALIRACIERFGLHKVAIGCPTGKAAVRISEAMQEQGVGLRARTWHSLLGVASESISGTWSFEHNERNPLPFDVLIGDETSMCDTNLMCSILRARGKAHLLLVGDVNQLPPVGHGAPFRDMINAGLPYGELREIKRNSGGIVEACASIRDEKPWRPGDNLLLHEKSTSESQIETILSELDRASCDGRNPIWDCQVLVPLNEKSPLSRKELNEVLQRHLNNNPKIDGVKFRIGDKIVNTKNGFFPAARPDEYVDGTSGGELDEIGEVQHNDQGEVYVANGELAEVINITETKSIIAKLSSPERVIRIYGKKTESQNDSSDEKTAVGTWDLGYALSCHKSQGSEWPVVIVAVDDYPGARAVCDRSWVYTAISRAKQRCVLIGQKSTADRFCRQAAIHRRKTFLRERIHLLQNERMLVEL